MQGESHRINQSQIEKLKILFPEVTSERKMDWERLKATHGNDITFSNERYVNESTENEITALKPGKCTALNKLFAGNDQLKTNTVLQMRDVGVEFKTI